MQSQRFIVWHPVVIAEFGRFFAVFREQNYPPVVARFNDCLRVEVYGGIEHVSAVIIAKRANVCSPSSKSETQRRSGANGP